MDEADELVEALAYASRARAASLRKSHRSAVGTCPQFRSLIENSQDFELAAPTTLTIVNFRVKAAGRSEQEMAAAHAEIVEAVTHDGQLWISDTVVNGRSVLRMMVISYLTEERHLESLKSALEAAARSTPHTAEAARRVRT